MNTYIFLCSGHTPWHWTVKFLPYVILICQTSFTANYVFRYSQVWGIRMWSPLEGHYSAYPTIVVILPCLIDFLSNSLSVSGSY